MYKKSRQEHDLFLMVPENQRTNGPVNAHLISGPIRFLKVFTINKHGGHLGHVTCTIYINFLSLFPRRLYMVSEKMYENNGYIHVVTCCLFFFLSLIYCLLTF